MLLLLDEVSEFLRSKPTAQAFNEDVRFLQFLGEWALDHRLWVVAAAQEQVEHAGKLESALYRKLKDRFPLRLLLTPTHVRELIRDHLLIKEPAYGTAVRALAREIQQACFQGLRSTSRRWRSCTPCTRRPSSCWRRCAITSPRLAASWTLC